MPLSYFVILHEVHGKIYIYATSYSVSQSPNILSDTRWGRIAKNKVKSEKKLLYDVKRTNLLL